MSGVTLEHGPERRGTDAPRQLLMDVTQAVLALGFGGATLWLFISSGNAPEGLIGLAGPIVTFYFRERGDMARAQARVAAAAAIGVATSGAAGALPHRGA